MIDLRGAWAAGQWWELSKDDSRARELKSRVNKGRSVRHSNQNCRIPTHAKSSSSVQATTSHIFASPPASSIIYAASGHRSFCFVEVVFGESTYQHVWPSSREGHCKRFCFVVRWGIIFLSFSPSPLSQRSQSLVVHLMKPGSSGVPAKEGYVGWTGMASASSLVQLQSQTSSRSREGSSVLETVEIDPQFAGALGFDQGDVIEIGLLHDLPVATSIATEPLSADDWEILVCFGFFRNICSAANTLELPASRSCMQGMLRITC